MTTSSQIPRTRPTTDKTDVRRLLVHAAVDVLSDTGPGGLTLREVARRTGVHAGAPARHFRDREGLLAAVASEGLGALHTATEQAMAKVGTDALARLHAAGLAHVRFALTQPALYRTMMTSDLLHGQRHPAVTEATARCFRQLVAAVEAGQAAGKVRPWPPSELALTVWSLMHGLAMLLLDGQLAFLGLQEADGDRLSRWVAERLLQGIAR